MPKVSKVELLNDIARLRILSAGLAPQQLIKIVAVLDELFAHCMKVDNLNIEIAELKLAKLESEFKLESRLADAKKVVEKARAVMAAADANKLEEGDMTVMPMDTIDDLRNTFRTYDEARKEEK